DAFKVELWDEYFAPRYGEPNAGTLAAIRLLASHEGLLLDPVYTGKAMAGLLDGIARQRFDEGPLIFLHTGGAPALFAYPEWDGILAALESKRLDIVVNQVTISDERKKKYDFSEPYTVSGIQALVLTKNKDTIKTAQDLAGKKVGVGLGTNYEQWLKDNVPKAIIKTYDDDPSKFQDLRVGRIDAILIDRLA
uniref:PBPb domain-containing protein n=1 Tax=Steinernema glaseri TaxID=37863 RepID=A0A1I7XW78_9BILA